MLHIIEKTSDSYETALKREYRIEGIYGDVTKSIRKGDSVVICVVTETACTYSEFFIAKVLNVEYFSNGNFTMIEYSEAGTVKYKETQHPQLL